MRLKKISTLRSLFFLLCSSLLYTQNNFARDIGEGRVIRKIIITGSKRFPKETIQSKLPYHVGEEFWADKSNQAIENIYRVSHFEQIILKTENIKGIS